MSHKYEPGCYGDGTFGHQHTRERCADIIEELYEPDGKGFDGRLLAQELRGEMSDDAAEEIDACDWLDEHVAVEGASWGWRDGDFGLWLDGEE